MFCSAVVTLDAAMLSAVTPLLPHYARTLHLTGLETGLLSGAYALGMLVSAVPAGVLVDRVGVRAMMQAGLILMAASSLVFASAGSFQVLVLARALQGLGGACSGAAALGWIVHVSASTRGATIGTLNAAGIAGGIGGPLLGVAVRLTSQGVVFEVVGAAAVALGACAWRYPEPRRGRAVTTGWGAAAANQQLRVGFLLTALCSMTFGCLAVALPLRLSGAGWGTTAIGCLFLTIAAATALGSPFAGRLSDRHGRAGPAAIAVLVATLGAVALATTLPAYGVAALATATEVALGLMYSPAMAWLADGAATSRVAPGVASGLMNAAWAVGQGVGGPLAGLLVRMSPHAIYLLLAVVFCPTARFVWRERRREAVERGGAALP